MLINIEHVCTHTHKLWSYGSKVRENSLTNFIFE